LTNPSYEKEWGVNEVVEEMEGGRRIRSCLTFRRGGAHPAWWGSSAAARERRRTVTRTRDEREELTWKRSVVCGGAVENSRVFQGIGVGQNAKSVQPNAVLGREGELSHALA
jgi:hypothetical protein